MLWGDWGRSGGDYGGSSAASSSAAAAGTVIFSHHLHSFSSSEYFLLALHVVQLSTQASVKRRHLRI